MINITKKHEVVDEVEDVHRLRRAWYYTLFIVFGLILLVCVLVLVQVITLPRRFPTLFCWEKKFLNETKKIAACRGASLTAGEEWLRPNVSATQLGLLRAFPSLYSGLNALTIFKYVPESAGEFLELCIAKFGAQCPYLVWRGTWTDKESPLAYLQDQVLPDPSVTGNPNNAQPCNPWENLDKKTPPVKFAGTEVSCQWRCWLALGKRPTAQQKTSPTCDAGCSTEFESCPQSGGVTVTRGWFNRTCQHNPFYDWFSSNQDAFFRTPAVVEYVSLLGTPQLSSMSKLYTLYEKGLTGFAIQTLESSSSMSGLDLFNYMFNPSDIVRTPPEDCSNVYASTLASDATSTFGLGSMALPFLGPVGGPIAAVGGGVGAYFWGRSQATSATKACKEKASAWAVPTNPPSSAGKTCNTTERNNCMLDPQTDKFVIGEFPCTAGFKP